MLRWVIAGGLVLFVALVVNPVVATDPPPPAQNPPAVDEPPQPEAPPAEVSPDREPVPPARRPAAGPIMGRGGRGGVAVGGGRPGLRPEAPLGPLMRLLAEHRPELAERLERVRREDPKRFERILMEALAPRIERALDEEAERPLGPRGGLLPPGERPAPPPEQAEFEQRMRALHEEEEHLERHSQELAQRLRELRRDDPNPEAREGLRRELIETIQRHFDVRGELRRAEVQQMERELRNLHERLERLQQDLERRAEQREVIVRRRAHELLGEEGAGW